MAIEKMKSIRDTFTYQAINKEGSLDKIIKTFLTKAITANANMLMTQYSTIQSYYKSALKTPVMDAVMDGLVIPMIYPKGITANNKVPTSIPFILLQTGNGIKAVAVIDNWATISDDNKSVVIDPNKLYTFIEGAFIARALELQFNTIRHAAILHTDAASIYAQMFTRVLNRDFALNVDKDAYNKVLFLSAKFFLLNLLQLKNNDSIFNYASKAAGVTSAIALKRLDDAFSDDCYKDISTFIMAIKQKAYMINNGLAKLDVRTYMERYIRMYKNASLFSLEHLSYFLFNIFACLNGAHINDSYAWEAAMGKKSGDKLYGFISNAVHNS